MFAYTRQSEIDKHTYLAGGCIYSLYNDKTINDYDIWCDSLETVELLEKLTESLNIEAQESSFIVSTSNAISIRFGGEDFQIIKKWYGEPDEVVGQFDFYHNHFAFIDGKIISFHNWKYINTTRLCFNFDRGRDIVNVLLRIPKFIKKGFYIPKEEHLKIIKIALKNSQAELESIESQPAQERY